MIRGIQHVQVSAPPGCEAAARAFYGDLLALREVEKPPALKARGGAWFELPNGQHLHVGVEQEFAAARKAHPAFEVEGLEALRARVEAAGFVTESDDAFIGYARFYAHDPWGNRIEFLERVSDGG